MSLAGSYQIFISYAREDGIDIALKLRNDLVAAGHDVWLDLAEIAAGASWARDIESAIENCDIALTLLSHGAYVSDICRGEQLRALRKEKRVIPLLIQPDADRPLHLEHLNYVDFSDPQTYRHRLEDLLHYINTGQNPPPAPPVVDAAKIAFSALETTPMPPVIQPTAAPHTVKRDARAFKRYLTELREEPWLGARHWWTFFLFYYADVQDIAAILEAGLIAPPARQYRHADLWDQSVRLNFRPRTPDLWGCEGIRPIVQRTAAHCPVPVYLLFDMAQVITLMEARFSEGDVTQTKKTYKTAAAFRDLPFHLIYHDQWLRKEERDEILRARRAQVILPEALSLDSLQHIICRSPAEADTLLTLLSPATRHDWHSRIAVKPNYHLFNSQWSYVNQTTLSQEGAHFIFHTPQDPETFALRVTMTTPDKQQHDLDLGNMSLADDFALDLTALDLRDGYSLRLYLDDVLAYAGTYA